MSEQPTGTGRRTRAATLAAGAVVLVLTAFGLGLLVASVSGDDGSGDDKAALPATTTTEQATTTAGNTPLTTGATTEPPPGKALGSEGALLRSTDPATVASTAPADAPCSAMVGAGWKLAGCGALIAGGGRSYYWVLERRADPGGAGPGPDLWRASLLHHNPSGNGWVVDLVYDEAPPQQGAGLESVKVESADLISGGSSELVFSFRSAGSGSRLTYDIVVITDGGPTVAASEVANFIEVEDGAVLAYENVFLPGDPGCCPSARDVSAVRWYPGGFRIVEQGRQSA